MTKLKNGENRGLSLLRGVQADLDIPGRIKFAKMPESPCQRYGLLRLPKVTERRDGPRPGDNDDDEGRWKTLIWIKFDSKSTPSVYLSKPNLARIGLGAWVKEPPKFPTLFIYAWLYTWRQYMPITMKFGAVKCRMWLRSGMGGTGAHKN